MKILLLPGASDSNKEWADDWEAALSQRGFEVEKLYYDHWGKEEMFSFKNEASKLSVLDRSVTNDCVVVAKSIGTLLAIYAVQNKIISPSSAIFMGFPSNIQGEKDASIVIDIKGWLAGYSIPTHVIQNESDPVTSYEKVHAFLEAAPSFNIESVPGDTHKYVPGALLSKVLEYLPK